MGQVGGFKETAEFFELRAAKAKDELTRKRYTENAAFYRALAAIVSTLPMGFSIPGATNANSWLNRADICRMLAEAYKDPTCCRQLMDLAATCERLAAR